MWINGRDPMDDGWIPVGIDGWMSAPLVSRAVAMLPNIGGVSPSTVQQVEPRQIRLAFRRYLTALDDREAAVLTLQDRLSGLLWVRFDDRPDRVVRCVAGAVQIRPVSEFSVFSVATIEAIVPLVAYDGASYDCEPRIIALATTPTEIALGTLPSTAFLLWNGPWTATTARTITLRDAGGVARTTMTFTAPSGESLGASDVLEIDLSRRYVTKLASGVRTSQYDWYTSGDWLAMDPAYQDRAAGRYCTLEVSAAECQIVYRKAYAL